MWSFPNHMVTLMSGFKGWLQRHLSCSNSLHQPGNRQTQIKFSSVQFSHSVMSDSLKPHGLQHTRLPCPSPIPRACSNSCPSSQWGHPSISSSVVRFSSTFNLSQHQGLFQSVSSSHEVAKVLEFQLQYQSFQWIFRTDFLWMDWLDLLAVQGTLESLLQHHS